jgi:hypothetical protein
MQPWFNYEGAIQQLRVIVRTAMLIGEAPGEPKWSQSSEFRDAGERRVSGGSQ